ncbi:hypothetical protein [Streptomyces sp. NPDC057302]|uniref:hypothetical protein n=1 Tax=Streptomyces sp. NPDC057302 TaxID=3346094 RepID=UPI00362EA916
MDRISGSRFRPVADRLDKPGETFLLAAAGAAGRQVTGPRRGQAVDNVEGHAGPGADCAREQQARLVEEHDAFAARPPLPG